MSEKTSRIIALYKVFSGEELLRASVMSILPFVEKIVLVYSDTSWLGARQNPCLRVINELKERYPDRILAIRNDEVDQLKHCQAGYDYIKHNLSCDLIQLIDSDEIWDKENYQKAIKFTKDNPDCNVYRAKMLTYLKSINYRVDPPEPTQPVCFVRPNIEDLGKHARACDIEPYAMMKDVYFHHLIYVRKNFNSILEKIVQSHLSEGQPYQDMSVWIPEVWNKLPDYNKKLFPKGFQPAVGYASNWKRLIKVKETDLPDELKRVRFDD